MIRRVVEGGGGDEHMNEMGVCVVNIITYIY